MRMFLVTLPDGQRFLKDECTIEPWVFGYFDVLPFDHITLLETISELPVSSQYTTASVTFRCIGESYE